jgi:prolyl 4-hydroxylase
MNSAPEPSVSGSPTYIRVDGQDIKIVAKMSLPRVVIFDNFLSFAECEELINGVEDKIEQSTVVDETAKKSVPHPSRTSSGAFYHRGQTETVARIEQRIAKLLNWPIENGEGLQVLKYEIGQEYRPHNDYFGSMANEYGSQRVGTFIMYLNTPTRGGGTTFPDSGFEITPQAGSALFFSYKNADASSKTLHAGTPVLEGEKWVATKWLRNSRY